jgi:hypothetical protein
VSYYPDLSPYSYGELQCECESPVNVGWLDPEFDYSRGAVPEEFSARLRKLVKKPLNLTRGSHFCGLCIAELKESVPPATSDMVVYNTLLDRGGLGNGEIVVVDPSAGTCFVSPVMILHYVEHHGYLPPPQYVDAVSSSA